MSKLNSLHVTMRLLAASFNTGDGSNRLQSNETCLKKKINPSLGKEASL